MSAIVKQLASSAAGLALQAPVVNMYAARKAAGFSSNSLAFQESLALIISLAGAYSHTSIVVDALDECDPLKRRKFLDSLQTIIKSGSASGIVKIFVSSRDDHDIVRRLDGVPNHWIEAKDNKVDIERFVESEITNCIDSGELLDGVVDNGLRGRIIESLTEGSQGMYDSECPPFLKLNWILKSIPHRFLWVDLQIKELCAMDVASDVESRLGALPDTLANTYTEIYKRIMSQRGASPELAKRALMWVMCSCRPFSPDDLATAVLFGFPASGLDARSVFKICHNLLTFDRQLNAVRFAHLSVREFLEQNKFTTTEAHIMASEACVSQMMEPTSFSDIRALGDQADDIWYPVIGYPAIYWPTHVVECQDQLAGGNRKFPGLLIDFLRRFYVDWLSTAQAINSRKDIMIHSVPLRKLYLLNFSPRNPLQLASVFGFREILNDLWDSESWNVNDTNSTLNTVLSLAAEAGFLWVTGTLLKKGGNINVGGGLYDDALRTAVRFKGNEQVVQLLLKHGADVNAQGGKYGNALYIAAVTDENEMMVELLLANGADVNAQGGPDGNALCAAVRQNEEMVEILLANGADVNAQGGPHGNALCAAVGIDENEMVVELLLANGADVNAQGGRHGNALCAAVRIAGNERVIELLLENGANVNAQGGRHGNSLFAAVRMAGNERVVELLLQNGADVNANFRSHGSPLCYAVLTAGNIRMVKLLLENGADVNGQGGRHGNSLCAAVMLEGNQRVVKLLLQNGANVNAQGGPHGNAFRAANGRKTMIKLLVAHGADETLTAA